MTLTPLNENRLTRLETVTLGVEGEGGLMKRVAKLEQRVDAMTIRIVVFAGVGVALISKGTEVGLSVISMLAKHLLS
jgi:hypothetical protein